MSYSKTVSIFTISTVHIIALLILVGFSMYIYIRASKDKLLYSFLMVELSFGIWILAKILKTVSPIFGFRWFFVVFQYFGICLLEVTFLNFAYIYARNKPLPKKFIKVLQVIASIQFLVIASNEYHHLFYSRFDFWGDDFGILFYFHLVIMYGAIISGIVLIATKFRKDFYQRKEFLEISIAIIIPLLANIYYLSGYYHKLMKTLNLRSFDITPLAFSLSLGVFAYAIYKKDFLDLLPLLEDEIIKHTNTGVLILNRKNNVIDMNQAAQSFKDGGWKHNDYYDGIESVDTIEELQDGRFVHIQKRILLDQRLLVFGYLVTLMDVTSYLKIKDDLENQVEEIKAINYELKEKIQLNDTLHTISARNYVARELHDILGHSMTLAIKLLEIAKMECDESDECQKETIYKRIEEAHNICQKGYLDLRKSLIHKQEMSYDLISLKTEVNKMGKVLSVAGVEFDLTMSSVKGLLNEDEYRTIKRFCQECITNSVKHGKASHVWINMDFSPKQTCVKVEDNGVGCDTFIKGNGLLGMEDRSQSIDGSIVYKPVNGKGFVITLEY